MKSKKKVLFGLAVAVPVILAGNLLPTPDGLSRMGMIAGSVFFAAIVLWLTEPLPMGVTGLTMMMLLVLFGVYSMEDAYRSFAGMTFFFVLAAYATNACLKETSLPNRICAIFVRLAKGDSRRFVLGFMLATAALSSIMSNMATCALMSGPALKLLQLNGNPRPGSSKLGKCLMIGVPIACGAGGFITPAGTPSNVIGMNLLKSTLGVEISFLQWTAVGLPIALLSVLVTGLTLTLIFRPEPLSQAVLDYAGGLHEELGRLTLRERKTLVIIGAEVLLWLLGTWVELLDITLVAILCMAVMFLPGVAVLDWKTYNKHANYDCLFMMGGITALAEALSISGATQWMVDTVIPDMRQFPALAVFLLCSVLVAVFHMMIPAGTAVLTLAAVPILGIAADTGLNGAALILIASFWAGAVFFLPFDGVPLLTYGFGYYKMTDMTKMGVIPYLVLIPGVALLIPGICAAFGIGG